MHSHLLTEDKMTELSGHTQVTVDRLEDGKRYKVLIEVDVKKCGIRWMRCAECKSDLEFMIGYQVVCVDALKDATFYENKDAKP